MKIAYLRYLENRLELEQEEYKRVSEIDSTKAVIEVYPKILMLESLIRTYKEYMEVE